jgi:hypothetical protein
MQVLFTMAYPGYLRYFDMTVAELTARGHAVSLAFESPKHQYDGLQALDLSDRRLTVVGAVPARRDTWEPVARHVRRVTDYIRYLDPRFADAVYLRRRTGAVLARPLQGLSRIEHLPERGRLLAMRALELAERSIPPAPRLDAFLQELRPDVVVLTPLVTDASRLNDLAKSAHLRGIPTVLAVASWDHLTTKGVIRVPVDRVLVWNEAQKREAVDLHGIPAEQVVVTGAQPFDRWFARQPTLSEQDFRVKVGLPAGGDLVLFVGSTMSISAPDAEERWVREWLGALRASDDPRLREVAVLVRPHPYNLGSWRDANLEELGPVAVWPRRRVSIVDEDNRRDYFDSLHHASAVVGVNTSAMVEAAVVGRPVLSVLAEEFRDSQQGTLHFQHLRRDGGGCVVEALSLEEHLSQLAKVLAGDVPDTTAFVRSFVRPHGLDEAATPRVADAIEQAADLRPVPRRSGGMALRPLVWTSGIAIELGTAERRRHALAMLSERIFRPAQKQVRRSTAALAGRVKGAMPARERHQ